MIVLTNSAKKAIGVTCIIVALIDFLLITVDTLGIISVPYIENFAVNIAFGMIFLLSILMMISHEHLPWKMGYSTLLFNK